MTLIERDPLMIDHANKTLKHESNQLLAPRVSLIDSDVTLTGKHRVAAGLTDNTFDFAIMNPPFNPAHDRRTPDPVKAAAHVMDDGLLENWLRTAAAIVAVPRRARGTARRSPPPRRGRGPDRRASMSEGIVQTGERPLGLTIWAR